MHLSDSLRKHVYYREIPRISLSLILRLIHDARVFAAHDDDDGAAAIIGLFSGGIRGRH